MPPSPLLPTPPPLPQNSSQPRNDDERGPGIITFLSFCLLLMILFIYIETMTCNRTTTITIPGLPRQREPLHHVAQRRRRRPLPNTTQWQCQLRRRSPSIGGVFFLITNFNFYFLVLKTTTSVRPSHLEGIVYLFFISRLGRELCFSFSHFTVLLATSKFKCVCSYKYPLRGIF